MESKRELRRRFKIKREYFQHSAREVADGAICDLVLHFLSGYESFLIYNSFSSEADTRAIITKLLDCGKRVYLPRVEGENIVPVRYYGKKEELKFNGYGIEEPVGQACGESIDVCITPLLAVNAEGYRLGYGGGYYDRYFKANKNILKVGIGYFLQYSEVFSADEWDEPLDKFICERGIIDFGNANAT